FDIVGEEGVCQALCRVGVGQLDVQQVQGGRVVGCRAGVVGGEPDAAAAVGRPRARGPVAVRVHAGGCADGRTDDRVVAPTDGDTVSDTHAKCLGEAAFEHRATAADPRAGGHQRPVHGGRRVLTPFDRGVLRAPVYADGGGEPGDRVGDRVHAGGVGDAPGQSGRVRGGGDGRDVRARGGLTGLHVPGGHGIVGGQSQGEGGGGGGDHDKEHDGLTGTAPQVP